MKSGYRPSFILLAAVLFAWPVYGYASPIKSCISFFNGLSASARQFKKVSEAFKSSELTLFYDGREAMPSALIEPGKSYTVVVHKGKLIIGKDTPAYNTNKIGSRGSHITLIGLFTKIEVDASYIGNSGAIKFHPNGVIDISGYHHKKISQEAADKIAELVKAIIPEAKLRITADRLNALDQEKSLSK